MEIAFVIPAFNEEQLLERTVLGVLAFCERVVIVDDKSRDRTLAIAMSLARAHADRVLVVSHEKNFGVGRAVVSGIRRALELRDVDAVGTIAADDQCDPGLIPVFRRILERDPSVDVAKGSRFLHAESLHEMPRFRYWGNRFVSLSMQLVLGYWGMSDVLHGYLLARRRVFEAMELSSISDGYDLENTMLSEFRRLRATFALVPSPSRYGGEQSWINVRQQIPRTVVTMGRLWIKRWQSARRLERLGPLLSLGVVPSGGLLLLPALLHIRLTSPRVERVAAGEP